jgi:hypothetical protein
MIKLPEPKKINVTHAAFAQAVILIIVAAINGVYSGLSSCLSANKADCAVNSVMAVILVLLMIAWFGFLAALAYAAWVRRTTPIIVMFIGAEFITCGLSLFDLKLQDSWVGILTSLIFLIVSLFVLYTSYFLFKLRGTSSAPARGRSRSKLRH